MLDTQSVAKKSLAREKKLFFWRLGSLRLLGGFRDFDAPDIFCGLQHDTDLVGFSGANLANPDDAETGFAPQAAHLDGLARSG